MTHLFQGTSDKVKFQCKEVRARGRSLAGLLPFCLRSPGFLRWRSHLAHLVVFLQELPNAFSAGLKEGAELPAEQGC